MSVLAVRTVAGAAYVRAGGGTPGDITTLMTALGVTVNGFFDCRTGIVLSTQRTVANWNDVSGHSLSLAQATLAKQPSVAADGSLFFTGAGGMNLLQSASALLNISGSYTLIVVGAFTGSQTGTGYIAAIGDASNEFLGINQGGGSNVWAAKGGKVLATATTGVSTAATQYREVSATLNGTTPLGIQVPNQAIVTAAIGTANTNASAVLCAGGFNGASGSAQCNLRAIICLPSLISAANLALVMAWAAANHNAVAA